MSPKMILVMCGLPGAGKSHWARRLQASAASSRNQVQAEAGCCDDEVRHVEFDAVEAGLFREAGDDGNLNDPLDTWHRARVKASEEAEAILLEAATEEPAESPKRRRRLALVLDDNMYYASMRREAYQLAARCGAGYGCVHVATPLDVALARNKARPPGQAVTEEVIRRMHTKLQVPDPAIRSWEANAVTILNATETRDEEAETLRKIWAVIECGWATPAIVPAPSAEEEVAKDADRRRTRENELHATELTLRKIIGMAMLVARGGEGALSESVSSLGPRFSAAKAVVMKAVGTGSVPHLLTLAGEDQAEATKMLLGKLFEALRAAGREEEAAALIELEQQTLARLGKM